MRLVKPCLPDGTADHAKPPDGSKTPTRPSPSPPHGAVPQAGGSDLELLMRDTDLAKHCCASTLCSLRLTSNAMLQSVRPDCTRATWQEGADVQDLGKYVHLQEMVYSSPWTEWQRLAGPQDCEAELLRTCMTGLPGLRKLSLRGSAFTAAQASLPSWQLPALISLSLGWSETGFGDAGAAAVAMAALPALEELDLQRNCIGPKGAAALAAGTWPSLHTLSLDGNCVGPEGAAALAAGAWPSLHVLKLTGNQIGPRGVAALARTTGGWQLKELSLDRERVADGDIIATLVQRFSRTLEKVSFDQCLVGDDGARAIAATEWPFLRYLWLGGNDVGCDGAVALAACAFPAIKVMDLHFNPIKARGAIALAQANGWPVLHTLRLPVSPELYTKECHRTMCDTGWHCGTLRMSRFFCRPDNLPPKHNVDIQDVGVFDMYTSESDTEYASDTSTGNDSDGDVDTH